MGNVILRAYSWSCPWVLLGLWGESQGITRPENLKFSFKEERIQTFPALQRNIQFISLSILLKEVILTVNSDVHYKKHGCFLQYYHKAEQFKRT